MGGGSPWPAGKKERKVHKRLAEHLPKAFRGRQTHPIASRLRPPVVSYLHYPQEIRMPPRSSVTRFLASTFPLCRSFSHLGTTPQMPAVHGTVNNRQACTRHQLSTRTERVTLLLNTKSCPLCLCPQTPPPPSLQGTAGERSLQESSPEPDVKHHDLLSATAMSTRGFLHILFKQLV